MASLAEVAPRRNRFHALWYRGTKPNTRYVRIWIWLAVGMLVLAYLGRGTFPEAIYSWPAELRIPLQARTNEVVDELLGRTEIAGTPLRVWTRSAGEILGVPMRFLQNALAKGWLIPGATAADTVRIPPLSWLSIVVVAGYLGWLAAGQRLAIFAVLTFLYFLTFNLWLEAALTLASVIVAISVGAVVGVSAGIALWRWPKLEAIVNPVFDIMQTIPPFSYLVPVLILFGFGPVAALVATLIFALPPMARATVYGLRRLPTETRELADMIGASPRQRMVRIFLPTARDDLLLGVNQLVMMVLAMVILASMIGAGGLGGEVLKAIQSLRFGRGLEAGLAITAMAILLYGYGHSLATRRPSHLRKPRAMRHLLVIVFVLAVSTLAGYSYAPLSTYPKDWTISTSDFWSAGIALLNTNFGVWFDAMRVALIVDVLRPVLQFMQGFGWAAVAMSLLCVGFALGRVTLGALSAATVLAIASIGYWDKTLITLQLVTVGTTLALLFGLPIGVWAASSPRVHWLAEMVVTTLQTLPSFVYLIPVVMLFGPGDVSGVFAIAMYSVATSIRYTDHALRGVDRNIIEAASSFGATPFQIFMKVRLPLAWPGLLLGLNQTVMMSVGMVVITSLVGTQGLELETLDAIARVDAGRGLVAGLAISALAIVIDRFIEALVVHASPDRR
jgi:glycine betaine/proline transport system permease protein